MMWFRRPFRQPVWSQIACGRGLGVLGCGVITLLVLFLAANLIQSARAAEAKDDSAGWRTVEVPRDATNGLGSWIWAAQTSDKQICQLWRSFEIPRGAKVSRAILRITADNGFRPVSYTHLRA